MSQVQPTKAHRFPVYRLRWLPESSGTLLVTFPHPADAVCPLCIFSQDCMPHFWVRRVECHVEVVGMESEEVRELKGKRSSRDVPREDAL